VANVPCIEAAAEPQSTHMFDATIAANLRLARPGATDAELMARGTHGELTAHAGPYRAMWQAGPVMSG
jgi:ABC-type transport system involved in cytochrome bd biosynthesis fused ATPase/permease subunit